LFYRFEATANGEANIELYDIAGGELRMENGELRKGEYIQVERIGGGIYV